MSKKYKMIQIDEEVHSLLKKYCKERGHSMKGLVQKLIKDRISAKSPYKKNVLPVDSKV